MHDEQLRHPERIMATEGTAVSVVAEDLTRTSFWSTGQPNNNELGSIHPSIQAAIDASEVTLGWDKTPGPGSSMTSQISDTAPDAVSPEIHEIKCYRRDGVLVSVASDGGRRLSAGLVAGALVGAFCLGWVGGSNSHRLLNLSAALNPLTQRLNSSPHILGSEKKTVTKIENLASSTTSKVGPDIPSTRKVSASQASSPDNAFKPSPGAPLAAISPSTVSSVAQENIISPGPADAQSDERVFPRLTPTPDTRPATIEGWTVRHVYGGRVVLEGPGGVWTAIRGDTVPGVGRIDSIVLWGGRWIVATTNGLITTQ